MKTLLGILSLWISLAALSWIMGSVPGGDMKQFFTVGVLFGLPSLAVWLTVKAASSLPKYRLARIGFWTVTTGGWLAALLLTQERFDSPDSDVRQNFIFAMGLAIFMAGWIAAKLRTWPAWRMLGEIAAGVAILAAVSGVFAWSYEARTRTLTARAEARWSEIGLPMSEFGKTLTPSHENAGSEVVRRALREQVSTRFYKEGTAAAEREPNVERSDEKRNLVSRACKLIGAKLPPSDDLDLTAALESDHRASRWAAHDDLTPVAATEPVAPALGAAYERILATEPAMWACDPHGGYKISVPNFLGVRMFCQLTAAESMRLLAAGDQEGAARAIAAGLRISEGLKEHPTLVGLMIHVAIDALFAMHQVRLPATEDGLPAVARDVATLRAEFIRRMQLEAWTCLHFSEQLIADETISFSTTRALPKWARQIVHRPAIRRQCAVAVLNGAEHAALLQSPATLTLPDFGASLHDAISLRSPTMMEPNYSRAAMRIHATLLLREQTELLRNARASLAAGRPVESRDSVVLPGLRWELTANAEKNTVATHLVGAPEWILKGTVTGDAFWVLPIDGRVAWQFRRTGRTASRF